jgi:hypothetical protein
MWFMGSSISGFTRTTHRAHRRVAWRRRSDILCIFTCTRLTTAAHQKKGSLVHNTTSSLPFPLSRIGTIFMATRAPQIILNLLTRVITRIYINTLQKPTKLLTVATAPCKRPFFPTVYREMWRMDRKKRRKLLFAPSEKTRVY